MPLPGPDPVAVGPSGISGDAGKAPDVNLKRGFVRTKQKRAQPDPTRFSSVVAAPSHEISNDGALFVLNGVAGGFQRTSRAPRAAEW